jgi:outer membrane protein assembly factor BamB
LTFSTLLSSMQIVDAQVINRPTHAYSTLSANPIGVGQTEVITFRIVELNPLSSGIFVSEVWRGFTVKITKPDGTTETKGPFNADTTGGSYALYTPTQPGEYSFQTIFPGQWVNGSYTTVANTGAWSNVTGQPLKSANLWFTPSESPIVTLKVQQDPIPTYPDDPLPTGYWTRPVYGENKGWSAIADNWLMRGYDTINRPFQNGAAFAPYTSAPNSPHILWNQPITFGGISGGKFGDKVYYTGLSYETFYEQLILNGRIYYQDHGPVTSADTFGTNVLDLYTGKQVLYMSNIKTDLAQVLDFESGNEHGLLSLLWSMSGTTANGTWIMYDAFSGRQILTVTNVTSGSEGAQSVSTVFGPNGELLSYSLSGTGANRRLIMWNSTLAIAGPLNAYFSPRVGSVIDGRRGIQWNVSIPAMAFNPSIIAIGEGYILTQGFDKSGYPFIYEDAAYPATLQIGSDGKYPDSIQPLWIQNRTNLYSGFYRTPRNIEDGVYTLFDEPKIQYHGYDIKTGQELWTTESLSHSGWSVFTYVTIQAYGMLYEAGFDGHVRAFDVTNGNKVWDFFMGPAGLESPYGHWPSRAGFTVADGKIYTSNDEHTPDPVMWRGGKLYCLDAYTGKQYWNMSGWMRNPAISDGVLTAVNSYDNQIYTIGKGPSATTVTAPDTSVTQGSTIMIKGSVTDQSPGQQGTPAISDEDMAQWMEYLHMQKPMPTGAIGVPVKLTALDPNGNTQDIGTAMSDAFGSFGMAWTPSVSGTYQIVALFEGSNSYGSSSASTYIVVSQNAATPIPSQTPTTTATITPTPTQMVTASPSPVPNTGSGIGTEVYLAVAAAAIIAIVAATALVLRKRK